MIYKYNRFLSSLIITGLMLGTVFMPSMAFAVSSFPDVDKLSPNYGAIDYLKNNGIVVGYQDGTFKPDNSINRAEALKLVFLVRKSLNLPQAVKVKDISFPDVKKNDWFYDYVVDAYNLGIVQGYNDGYFRPNNKITNAESLKIIYTGLFSDLQLPTVKAPPFKGIDVNAWYAPYLLYGKNRLFIEANDDGEFLPEQNISRGSFSEAIYRVMFTLKNNQQNFPINTNWPVCNQSDLGYKIKRPYGWEAYGAGKQLILWKKDGANGQVSFARIYPNSAAVIVAVDENPNKLSLSSYLEQIEYGSQANRQFLTLNGLPYASVTLEQSGLQDSYFELPGGRILVVYTQTGDGVLSKQLREQIRYMLGSIRSSNAMENGDYNCLVKSLSVVSQAEDSVNLDNADSLRAFVLKNVLVSGYSAQILEKLSDKILFETDSIGIGTGPVDYYYSKQIDLTLKVDRNSLTLLSTKTGKTSSF